MTKDNDHRKVATHILTTANKVVTTERGNQHGGAEDSFQMIADLWMVYLNNTNRRNPLLDTAPSRIIVTPKDVALMMDLLKTARHTHGDPLNDDNFVDKAGYTGLAAALAGVMTPEARAAHEAEKMDRMTSEALARKLAPRQVPETKTLEVGNEEQQKRHPRQDAATGN
jgi:hypothetical protein